MSEKADLDVVALERAIHRLANIFSAVFGGLELMIHKTADNPEYKQVLIRTLTSAEGVHEVIAMLQKGLPNKSC